MTYNLLHHNLDIKPTNLFQLRTASTGKNAYQYVYAQFAVTILSAVYSHINTGMAWERCKSGMACMHP